MILIVYIANKRLAPWPTLIRTSGPHRFYAAANRLHQFAAIKRHLFPSCPVRLLTGVWGWQPPVSTRRVYTGALLARFVFPVLLSVRYTPTKRCPMDCWRVTKQRFVWAFLVFAQFVSCNEPIWGCTEEFPNTDFQAGANLLSQNIAWFIFLSPLLNAWKKRNIIAT